MLASAMKLDRDTIHFLRDEEEGGKNMARLERFQEIRSDSWQQQQKETTENNNFTRSIKVKVETDFCYIP